MNDYTQRLKEEIIEKNSLLNSFDENYDSDRKCAESVKNQLDGLLYRYFKTLRRDTTDED